MPAANVCQIGEKTFSGEDQRLFAQLSRDCNPMHMDPVAARRLMTGRPVVHGVHILLTALEYWQNDGASPPLAIAGTFNNPVSIGERLVFTQTDDGAGQSTIDATVNGMACAQITIATVPDKAPPRAEPASGEDTVLLAALPQPLDEAPEWHLGRHYALRPNDDAGVAARFPQSRQYLGKAGLAATAALSYIVGMVCPGLHSVFSSLTIDLLPDAPDDELLHFSVRKYDPRFRLFDIAFHGCIQGGIKAFQRPPPQPQPSLDDLAGAVDGEEFKGTRSLIIGGSRGLGEATAKILAAGGGDVVITYASGLADARTIGDEINSRGGSHCDILPLDLTAQAFSSIELDWNSLDAVYFFATPRIFRKKAELFEPGLFREFCDFYVGKFHELCVFLETAVTAGRIKVYFPSTVFVAERPKGMAEYAMAKSAAEVLIPEINRSFKHLTVVCTRLPRLNTDQTASIIKVATEGNVETLLPLIRAMQA